MWKKKKLLSVIEEIPTLLDRVKLKSELIQY